MVYSVGNGVHAFTLDPSIGTYILTHENIRIPEQGDYYSINEAYCEDFPKPYVEYIKDLKNGRLGKFYSSRFVGSLVADFHRTLLRGGIFLYPATKNYAEGRLRLLYEANPVAFIAEHAGGAASNGTKAILDIQPTELHQRTPLIVGGAFEMAEFENVSNNQQKVHSVTLSCAFIIISLERKAILQRSIVSAKQRKKNSLLNRKVKSGRISSRIDNSKRTPDN